MPPDESLQDLFGGRVEAPLDLAQPRLGVGKPLPAGCFADPAVHATGGGFHAALVGERAAAVSHHEDAAT